MHLLLFNYYYYYIYFSENKIKIYRQVEKINAVPLIDTWLIKHQHYLYTRSSGCETSGGVQNTQLNHQHRNLPSLMPIVNVDQLKNIELNTWS